MFRAQPSLAWDLGETQGTVALRMPNHPVALELLAETGPLAVSSANLSGQPAAMSCEDAQAMLGDSVSIYLDSGTLPTPPAGSEAASTILDFTGWGTDRGVVLVREGAIPVEELERVAGIEIHRPVPQNGGTTA